MAPKVASRGARHGSVLALYKQIHVAAVASGQLICQMGSRGEEILARVQQRISTLEDELQHELEKHNRSAVALIQHQIQELQAKYSGTSAAVVSFVWRTPCN
jgi:protein-arginine kinase activator protein McsA